MTLLGRDRLLSWAERAWADAFAGRGHVLLLSGEAGIGKTSLAREIVTQVQRHAANGSAVSVRWGAFWDGGAPLAPWIDVLGAEGDDECAVVAARLELPMTDDNEASRDDMKHGRLLTEVVRAIRAATARRPQLVVLDDLHWADSSSLMLLRAVAAHASTMHLLVVGTYRDDEVTPDSPLLGLGGNADHLELSGLAEDDVGQLLREVLGREPSPLEQREVHRQTGGNPLFVTHVGRLIDVGSPAVPEGIADVLARRLARLPPDCDRALGAASVLGQEFDADVVAGMLDISLDAALEALEPAIAARVAAPVAGSARRWSFTHVLVQRARYEALGAAPRAALHRRAFDLLANDGTTSRAVLAHHGARGTFAPVDARPAEAMLAAGDEAAARFASDDALARYADAHHHAPAGEAGDELQIRALLGLGRARLRRGQADEAGDAFEAAAAIARSSGRDDLLAQAALGYGSGLGAFEVRMLDRRQADLLEEAAAALDASSPLRPWVLARLSCALTLLGSEEHRLALADEAVAAARALGDRAALAAALASRCDAIAGPSHVDERADAADEIVRIGEELRDLNIELLGRRLRVVVLAERCDMVALDAEVARFERSATRLGDPLYSWYVPLWRAMRALSVAQLDDARRLADEARRLGVSGGSANALVLTLVVELYVALARDDVDDVRRVVDAMMHHVDLLLANSSPMLLWLDQRFGADDVAPRVRRIVDDLDNSLAFDAEWLGAVVPLVDLVFDLALGDLAPVLYGRLAPYASLGAVEGIAATQRGPVARWLALLAAQMGDAARVDAQIETSLRLAARCGSLVLADAQRAAASALRRLDAADAVKRADELEAAAARVLPGRRRPDDTTTSPAEAATPASMVRQGDAWAITWDGVTVQIRHAKGIADIAQLVAQPGHELHVRELEGLAANAPLSSDPTGDAADARAIAQYRARLRELEAELDEADRRGDIGRSALVAAERDSLVAELSRSLGLGGRTRRASSDPDERLRKAVSARVKASIDRLESLHPPLGRHLLASVRTGFWCSYRPERAVRWHVDADVSPLSPTDRSRRSGDASPDLAPNG